MDLFFSAVQFFQRTIVWVQQDHQYFDMELGTHHSRCFLCFLFLPTSARPPVPKFLRWSHSMCPKYKQQVCLEQWLLAASVLHLRIEGSDGLLILQILNPSVICRVLSSLAPLPSAKSEPSGPKLHQAFRASGCLVLLRVPSKSRLLIPW